MKILLTGATGYIGKRLLPELVSQGHHVVCCVRDKDRFSPPSALLTNIEIIEVDFLKKETLTHIPLDIDAAYYLMHSMSTSSNYAELELNSSRNFREAIKKTQVQQVLYLSGIINETELSKHLSSRKAVEEDLALGAYHFTTLRAGIIIGSGSASFEIIRDLVEKLPAMITPHWLNTKCQPIGIRDVITCLSKSLFKVETYDKNFDIGGPDILTYKEMLLGYAQVRGLKRKIWTIPVMTPKISSYWLYFVTSTSYKLAIALVNSMKVEVICRDNSIHDILQLQPISYHHAIVKAFEKIEGEQVVSSWKDAMISGQKNINLSDFLEIPSFGCFKDQRKIKVLDEKETISKIWSIGGETGWYYATWLWRIRGFLDKVFGGVGLRRGRTNKKELNNGDAVDFWRVLLADEPGKRLLLFAEMKLPGEAWLEFKLVDGYLHQTATFRPKGVIGRLYWYMVYPLHGFIFRGLIQKLAA
jgi:uncharacterized protein YbjT (DUF2867 family)